MRKAFSVKGWLSNSVENRDESIWILRMTKRATDTIEDETWSCVTARNKIWNDDFIVVIFSKDAAMILSLLIHLMTIRHESPCIWKSSDRETRPTEGGDAVAYNFKGHAWEKRQNIEHAEGPSAVAVIKNALIDSSRNFNAFSLKI